MLVANSRLPTVGGLLATSGEWAAYHVTILYAFLFCLQCLLLPETLYPREAVLIQESQLAKGADSTRTLILPSKKNDSKFNCLVGLPEFSNSFFAAFS